MIRFAYLAGLIFSKHVDADVRCYIVSGFSCERKYRAGFDSLREVINQDSNPVLLKYRLKNAG